MAITDIHVTLTWDKILNGMPDLMLATGTKYKRRKNNYKKQFSHGTDLGLLYINNQKYASGKGRPDWIVSSLKMKANKIY